MPDLWCPLRKHQSEPRKRQMPEQTMRRQAQEGLAMSLFDEIMAIHKEGTCAVKRIIGDLSKDDAADLTKALENTSIPAAHIARVLRNRGHVISDKVLSKHRRKDCACNG